MNTPKRYHPFLVTLHWLTVALLLGAGFLSEESGRSPINLHMILGALLLFIMVLRLVVRWATIQPAWADTGNPLLNKLGVWMHYGLYLAVFYILSVGALIAYDRNLFAYVMGTSTTVNRVGFIKEFHELGWLMVLGLMFAHVGAALYHQFILKDNLLSRMWFGRN